MLPIENEQATRLVKQFLQKRIAHRMKVGTKGKKNIQGLLELGIYTDILER